MRTTPHLTGPIATALALLCFTGVASVARAQNPDADQIINSLRPGSGDVGLTRGIRPVGPEPATEAPSPGPNRPHHRSYASGPVALHVGENGGAPAVNLTVGFETGSATLTPDAAHTLDQLGQALSSATLAAYRFRVEGHTDTVGDPAVNQALSERRAAAVVAYLERYFHVAADRLRPVGMGENGLLVATPPNTANAHNRRVEVVNLGT
jgi:OmpA-OmpF porin, OOP family